MPLFTDQTGNTILLHSIPNRIISLVPSQTELLHYLGLEEQVIGITKFCVHPQQWFRTKSRVGGTKQVSIDTIHRLQPDLIIANKEENVKEQVEALAAHYPVWVSDVNNLEDACNMIGSIGKMVQRTEAAQKLIARIQDEFEDLRKSVGTTVAQIQTAYLIWKDPLMSAGGDTFIHDMLTRAGFKNIFANRTRYPSTNIEELKTSNCQLLLLSSEPYPFKQQHADELQQQLPGIKMVLVDGEMFSWYGSRLLQAPAYLKQLHQMH